MALYGAGMRPTEPLRQEHAELLQHIEHLAAAARELPSLSDDERELVRRRILAFLSQTLMPHARVEEEVLYPEWATLVGSPDAAAPMVHDHEAIAARVDELAAAPISDTDRLQELLYGLYALISVHFDKEEDIQLPAFDADPDAAARLLDRLHVGAGHAHQH